MANEIQKTINTRIILKNADLSAWEKSVKPLSAGEVGLARTRNGNYIIRVGTNQTWNEMKASGKGQLLFSAGGYDYEDFTLSMDQDKQLYLAGKLNDDTYHTIGSKLSIDCGVNELFDAANKRINELSGKVDNLMSYLGKNSETIKESSLSCDLQQMIDNDQLTFLRFIDVNGNPCFQSDDDKENIELAASIKEILTFERENKQ